MMPLTFLFQQKIGYDVRVAKLAQTVANVLVNAKCKTHLNCGNETLKGVFCSQPYIIGSF